MSDIYVSTLKLQLYQSEVASAMPKHIAKEVQQIKQSILQLEMENKQRKVIDFNRILVAEGCHILPVPNAKGLMVPIDRDMPAGYMKLVKAADIEGLPHYVLDMWLVHYDLSLVCCQTSEPWDVVRRKSELLWIFLGGKWYNFK